MSVLVGIKDENLTIIERPKGSRGSNSYVYLLISDELVHIERIFRDKKQELRNYGYMLNIYELPLKEIKEKFGEQIVLYEFRYSNNRYLHIRKYIINCESKTVQTFLLNSDKILNLKFKIINSEKSTIEEYKKYAPKIVNEIKKIMKEMNMNFLFLGRPERIIDVYDNLDYGLNIAMIYPSERSRKLALKSYIRNIYKLYVLMLISKALNGKTKKFSDDNEPYWTIHFYSDEPTAIIEINDNKKYTIWFQFTAESWINVIFKGFKSEETLNVKQDIAIFEGEYKNRNKLEKNPPQKSIFITIKTKITKNDIKQLENYARLFGNIKNSTLILACLEKIKYKNLIENIGWIVVEDVFPEKEGEKRFMNLIKNLTR